MPKSLHEQASEIIAKAIAMSDADAIDFIKKKCSSNKELLDLVTELYQDVRDDDYVAEVETGLSFSIKGNTKSRIGAGGQTTKVVGSLTQVLFGEKRNRIITLSLILALSAGVGFLIRYKYRDYVLEMERKEQVAMLNINYTSLQQWIDTKTRLTRKLARNEEVIQATCTLDSLVEADPSYAKLHQYSGKEKIFSTINRIRNEHEVEALSIINKRDPTYMILTELASSGADNAFANQRLGVRGYEYYLRLQERKQSMFMPPMHDTEKFIELPEGLNVGTYCTFCEPIYKDDVLIGFLFIEYNSKNEFSSLLNSSHHKETAETYAFNRRGHLLSRSKFEKELQQTFLLDYDTAKESIYNVRLLDPGKSIYKSDAPKTPAIDQSYTRIMAQVLEQVGRHDSIFSGSLTKPYNDYRGIKVVGTWKWLPQYEFGIIDEIDAAEALNTLRFFDAIYFPFLFILIMLSVLLFNSNVRIAKFGKRIEDINKLGHYHLLSKLGEGGFGEVYKAEHNFLKTPVAIKLLKKEFIGTDMLDRFEREVRVTSSLAHPNTIKVFDYGTSASGQFYYVMEYLNGVSLDKVVSDDKKFPVGRAIHVLLNCCYSLQEAHSKGLVHRDIKPMNIMLCNQGGAYDVVKVLDFGLVKNIDTSISQQTQINRIGGTPMFMAPERFRDPFNTDHRVDIYAVGALGLHLLSGQYLLELISQKMLSGQDTLQGELKQNLIERNDVPDELKAILQACVSFEPDKRPHNLLEIIVVLEALQPKFPWLREEAQAWWNKYDVYG